MCVQVTWKNMPKFFVLLSSNNPLMLKWLKSVDLKIIQMYHFQLKWKRYTVCTNWWDSNFFGVGLPLFPVGLLLFARWESWSPVFKILVRALTIIYNRHSGLNKSRNLGWTYNIFVQAKMQTLMKFRNLIISVQANNVDPDEVLHSLPKYAFRSLQYRKLSSKNNKQGLPWLRICCSQHFSQMEKIGAKCN